MEICPDRQLMDLILQRSGFTQELQRIVIKNPKKQPKRVARRKRLRRAIRKVNRAIAERCHEIFTP